jgi:hypothetical protein
MHKAKQCDFCYGGLTVTYSDFNMISIDHEHAMCSHCLEKGLIGLKSSRVNKIVNGKDDWPSLAAKMRKAMTGCPGGMKMKKTVLRLALRLAVRAGNLRRDELDGVRNGRAEVLRVKTNDPEVLIDNLQAACEEAGIAVIESPQGAYEQGFAYRQMLRRYNTDSFMAQYGAIVVRGRAEPENFKPALVLIADHPDAVDCDGYDESEIS